MLHLREFLADAFCKSQSSLFDALMSVLAESACAAVHTPCAGHRADRRSGDEDTAAQEYLT